jgi:hypothetical protein
MQSLYSTLSTVVDAEGCDSGRTQETRAIETIDNDRIEFSEISATAGPTRGETRHTAKKETIDADQEVDGLSGLVDFDRR